MKLSFSLSSKSSSSRPLPTGTLRDGAGGREEQAEAASKSEFVTVFDPTVTLTPDAAPAAPIAPLPNSDSWRVPKRMKSLLPPPSDPDSSSTDRFELDTSQPDPGNVSYGLTLRSKGDGGDVGKDPDRDIAGGRSDPPASAEQKFREDMERLPEDRGLDEFQDISVEDFSRALLAGYGWKAGQGVGRNAKEDTQVREYKRWAGHGGLGFTPDMASEKKGRKKDREGLPPPPVSANGSVATNGGKTKVVRIVAGEHAGRKAVVLQKSTRSDSPRGTVVLSLLESELEVSVGLDMIAELGSAQEEKYLRKLKEVRAREGGERKDEKKRDRRKDDRKKDKGSSRGEEDGRSGIRDENHKGGEHCRPGGSDRGAEPVSWLRSHIRVRIISKGFKGGRLYLKKGVVMDVVGPVTCDLSMDDSGELLQGVEQVILETALPRRGGPVLVLFGRHKGRFGKLMEKVTEEETAVVQDADNHELIKVRLEQIAEYVGDPSVLGY